MTMWVAVLALAPFGLAMAVICIREPIRVALPIFAALIPFGERVSIGTSKYGSLSSLVGVLLGLGLILRLATGKRGAPRLSAAVPVWLLFLGLAIGSALWSIDRPTTLAGLAVIGSLILVFVLVAVTRVDRADVRRVENGLLVGGVGAVCYGLYQLIFLGGFPGGQPGSGIDPSGRFGNDLLNPGIQAISLLVPLVIAMTRAYSDRRWRWRYVAIAALMVCGVLMTASRAGTIATIVELAALIWVSPRRFRIRLASACAVGVAVSALVWTYHPAGIADRTFASPTSSSGRTDIWRVGLAACSHYCAYGSGWGTFPQVYAETQSSVPGARVLVGPQGSYQPHNLWLLAVIELGTPGLLLFCLGLVIGFVEAMRLPRSLRAPPLCALAGLVSAVFFLSSMEFKIFWMVFILIALARNAADADRVEVESTRELPGGSSFPLTPYRRLGVSPPSG
jgi:O-antigen ligase